MTEGNGNEFRTPKEPLLHFSDPCSTFKKPFASAKGFFFVVTASFCYKQLMSVDHFHMNRPVHLARRDVYFEQAVTLIGELVRKKEPAEQQQTAAQALFCLEEARRHGDAANQSSKTCRNSYLFQDLLETAIDNTHSIARMLRWRLAVDADDSPLDQFLDETDTGKKMGTHYRRCAAHILKGLLLVLGQAQRPVHDLQCSCLAKMAPDDKARYEKARDHFKKEAEQLP